MNNSYLLVIAADTALTFDVKCDSDRRTDIQDTINCLLASSVYSYFFSWGTGKKFRIPVKHIHKYYLIYFFMYQYIFIFYAL